jgi:hypothetical protein
MGHTHLKGSKMKLECLTIGACVSLLAMAVLMPPTVAGGVSQAQRTACERAAARVLPALRAEEKEAWIANCLADATAGSPPKKDRDY